MTPIILHELRIRRKVTLIWSILMILFMYLCMVEYASITQDMNASKELMNAFPDTIKAVFGMTGLDLTTVSGYFGVCFIFIAVLLAIHGGLLGVNLLAREELGHTTEFLYVKPRTRRLILSAKLIAGASIIVIVWAATTLGSIAAIHQYANFEGFSEDFWRMMTAGLIIQVTLFSIGFTIAATKKAGKSERTVAMLIVAAYALYVFAKLSPHLSWAQFLSIFHYFDAADILTAHALNVHYLILCLLVSVAAIVGAFIAYRRRDLHP